MLFKIVKFLFISSLSLGFYLSITFIINFSNNAQYSDIKNRIKWSIKDTLTANKELQFWKKEYEYNIQKIEKLEKIILEKDYLLAEIPNLIKQIPVKKNYSKIYNHENSEVLFNKFKTEYLTTSKHPGALGSSYIEFYDNKLFLVSGNGIIAYSAIENFDKEFNLDLIKTNIKDLFKDKLFYKNSEVGIKDVLVKDNKIYISLTNLQFHLKNAIILLFLFQI